MYRRLYLHDWAHASQLALFSRQPRPEATLRGHNSDLRVMIRFRGVQYPQRPAQNTFLLHKLKSHSGFDTQQIQ